MRPGFQHFCDRPSHRRGETAAAKGDQVRVLELLGAWPAPLAIFLRTPDGQMLNAETLGSIEYAVDHLAVRLIVVLGHQRCGAVKAAKDTIAAKTEAPAHIQSLVNAIRPPVEATVKGDLEATVEANVKNVVQALRSSTPILKPKVDSGEVRVIGGYYSLDTGSVTFLEEK